jgi:hypothetical protein
MSVAPENRSGTNHTIQNTILWIAVALLGAVAFAIVALNRGEAVNAAWLVVAAVCIYFIAYRFMASGLPTGLWASTLHG